MSTEVSCYCAPIDHFTRDKKSFSATSKNKWSSNVSNIRKGQLEGS